MRCALPYRRPVLSGRRRSHTPFRLRNRPLLPLHAPRQGQTLEIPLRTSLREGNPDWILYRQFICSRNQESGQSRVLEFACVEAILSSHPNLGPARCPKMASSPVERSRICSGRWEPPLCVVRLSIAETGRIRTGSTSACTPPSSSKTHFILSTASVSTPGGSTPPVRLPPSTHR